jgi:hypothetical protein
MGILSSKTGASFGRLRKTTNENLETTVKNLEKTNENSEKAIEMTYESIEKSKERKLQWTEKRREAPDIPDIPDIMLMLKGKVSEALRMMRRLL